MNCGLVAEDTKGDIAFVNQKLLDWLGYERDERVGKHVNVPVPQELHQFMEDDLQAAGEGDVRARRPKGMAPPAGSA
jgi:PAS domain S-box-containing protein